MLWAGARHLPVVDEAGAVVGMLSDRDVRSRVGDPWVALDHPEVRPLPPPLAQTGGQGGVQLDRRHVPPPLQQVSGQRPPAGTDLEHAGARRGAKRAGDPGRRGGADGVARLVRWTKDLLIATGHHERSGAAAAAGLSGPASLAS